MTVNSISKINKKLLFISKCCYKLKLNLLGKLIARPRQKVTLKFLKNIYSDLLNQKFDYSKLETISNDTSPIFVMWLQGEDGMPEVIKNCFNSIKKNVKNHNVILITEKNLKEYLELPDYIYEKISSGIITRTHFSDIVRAGLLYKYGGTWIDSSVFLSSPIPDSYFNNEFYGPCGFEKEMKKEWKYLYGDCLGWTAWFLGTKYKNYPFFNYLYNAFLIYWKNQDVMIDYFLVDFTISLFYKNNFEFKKYMDSRKKNNSKAYELYYLLNNPYKKNILDFLDETFIHKLTYKHQLLKYNNNRSTIYNELICNQENNNEN